MQRTLNCKSTADDKTIGLILPIIHFHSFVLTYWCAHEIIRVWLTKQFSILTNRETLSRGIKKRLKNYFSFFLFESLDSVLRSCFPNADECSAIANYELRMHWNANVYNIACLASPIRLPRCIKTSLIDEDTIHMTSILVTDRDLSTVTHWRFENDKNDIERKRTITIISIALIINMRLPVAFKI